MQFFYVCGEVHWSIKKERKTNLLVEFLRPSAIQRLFATITTIRSVPFSPGIRPESARETEIIQLSRGFSVGSSVVVVVRQHASFAILLDRLDLQVFEHVKPASRAELKKIINRVRNTI